MPNRPVRIVVLAALTAVLLAFLVTSGSGADAVNLPDPTVDETRATAKGKKTVVLAGGCFWCTEAVFEHVQGIDKVVSGYSGGDAAGAHYEIVSSGRTNHAESIQITYDPSKITLGQILKVFFSVAHDPTALNRQGPDHGKQYRSAIFFKDDEQKRIAESYVQQLTQAKVFHDPIVTEITALKAFYPAEEHHQDYVRNNPMDPYVMVNARPKLEKLKKQFPDLFKK